jgi:hypothetical protein
MRRESDHGHARLSLGRGSLSGDLLGKFSAIVRPRRTSVAEDNNGGGGGDHLPSPDSTDPTDRDVSLAESEGTTPSASSKPFGFMRRFSRATTPFTSSATEDNSGAMLPRMLDDDEPERQRRYEMEFMSFALLHAHLQPPNVPEAEEDGSDQEEADDNQVEEALQRAMEDSSGDDEDEPVRRKSRETTTDADEYALLEDADDEDLPMLLRLRLKRAVSDASSMEDDTEEQDDDDDDREDNHDDDDDRQEGELSFDGPHLGASVRKLVRQIENASFLETAVASSGSSNQNDDDNDDEVATTTHEPKDATRHSDPLASAVAVASPRRTTYPMVTAPPLPSPSPMPPRAPFLHQQLSCYIPMDEVQEDLTKSMRRIVLSLKQDAEAQHQRDHPPPFVRRRGNSCPSPFSPPSAPPTTSSAVEPMASAAPIALDAPPPSRWRKRSTLARLKDTFRLRKRTSYLYTDDELESIEGARWKIVELAFRFGGKHRAYLVQAVNMFFPLIKYGRHGGPHATRLHCNLCGTLQWQQKRGGLSTAVDLADVLQILDARQTAVFRKYVACAELDARSLSLVFPDRTLDLETQSASHRDWLLSALRTLVVYAKRQRQAEHRALAEQALLPLDDLQSHAHADGSNAGQRVRLW